jgi:hypothetical protein
MKGASDRGVDDMRPEYKRSDFGSLVRGKYAQRLRESSNVVVIEADLARIFPNARAVNTALRRRLRKPKSSAEYAFGGEVPGKTAARCREGINIVLLDSDVSAAFPNSEAVSKALREILDAMPARRSKPRRR